MQAPYRPKVVALMINTGVDMRASEFEAIFIIQTNRRRKLLDKNILRMRPSRRADFEAYNSLHVTQVLRGRSIADDFCIKQLLEAR